MNSSKENTRMCCMCGSSPSKDPNITLHRFPKPGSKNALRCELWAKYCFPNEAWSSPKFQNGLHSKHKMLCSKHFRSTCFVENKLFRTAVPEVQCDTEDTSVAGPSRIAAHLMEHNVNIMMVAMESGQSHPHAHHWNYWSHYWSPGENFKTKPCYCNGM